MTTFRLMSPLVRQNAMQAVKEADAGDIVSIRKPTRSDLQNKMLHAIFGDMAKSGFEWDGEPRSLEEWKHLCVSGHTIATGAPTQFTRGLEGELINIRESTAKMGVARAASLITYVIAFCDMNGIELTETKQSGLLDLEERNK